MPVIKLYQHGCTSGTPPMKNDHQRAPRGSTQGWTEGTVRSNLAFLRSVILRDLTGDGIAFTLTIRDCPPTASDWHRVRTAFVKRLRRMGMIRLHWVTEWQRRGVPHLHGVVYFDMDDPSQMPRYCSGLVDAWCAVAAEYTAGERAQDTKPITDALGWLQYLAKHASRGKTHYQRSSVSIPAGWKTSTGRMWGKSGNWSISDAMVFEIEDAGYWHYRRMVRGWRIADARASGNRFRIAAARRMLRANTREKAQTRGTSEWVPMATSLAMLAIVGSWGYHIEQ